MTAPLMAILGRSFRTGESPILKRKQSPLLRLFIAGFLMAVVVRTFVPMPDILLAVVELPANLLLATAMLGLASAPHD